jgi:hypothetical protein
MKDNVAVQSKNVEAGKDVGLILESHFLAICTHFDDSAPLGQSSSPERPVRHVSDSFRQKFKCHNHREAVC